jgi:hypothetical protein
MTLHATIWSANPAPAEEKSVDLRSFGVSA